MKIFRIEYIVRWRWRIENESWFDVKLVFIDYLPVEVFHAEGGINRRRSSGVSFKEAKEFIGGPKLKREED